MLVNRINVPLDEDRICHVFGYMRGPQIVILLKASYQMVYGKLSDMLQSKQMSALQLTAVGAVNRIHLASEILRDQAIFVTPQRGRLSLRVIRSQESGVSCVNYEISKETEKFADSGLADELGSYFDCIFPQGVSSAGQHVLIATRFYQSPDKVYCLLAVSLPTEADQKPRVLDFCKVPLANDVTSFRIVSVCAKLPVHIDVDLSSASMRVHVLKAGRIQCMGRGKPLKLTNRISQLWNPSNYNKLVCISTAAGQEMRLAMLIKTGNGDSDMPSLKTHAGKKVHPNTMAIVRYFKLKIK